LGETIGSSPNANNTVGSKPGGSDEQPDAAAESNPPQSNTPMALDDSGASYAQR
jgi:hypothetical protein